MKVVTMYETTRLLKPREIILPIHTMPITITSEMITFNQCLYERVNNILLLLLYAPQYFAVSLLDFFSCFFRCLYIMTRVMIRNPTLTWHAEN